jgi:hypothetical protein
MMALDIVVSALEGRTVEARAQYARCALCKPVGGVDPLTRNAVLRGDAAAFFQRLAPQLSEPYPDGPQPVDAAHAAASGRYNEALRLITPRVAAQRSRPDLRFYRGLLFFATGHPAEARRDLAVAALFRPTLPDPGVPRPLDPLQQVALWTIVAPGSARVH